MRCDVPNCKNDSTKTSQEITYHIFPTQSSLRAAWLDALLMSEWEPEERSVVCSCHFQQEDLLSSAEPLRDARVCRICFATDCEQYPMTANKSLCKAYETLTGLSIQNDVNLPQHVCSECACRLLNYTRFRATSLRAHSVLLDVVSNYGYITLELLQTVKGVQSPRNLNPTDCDWDIELAEKENTYTEEQDNATVGIKIENDDLISQNTVNGADSIGDDKMSVIKLEEDIVDDAVNVGIKTESEETISLNNNNAEDITNDGVMHEDITNGSVNIAVDSVKIENCELTSRDQNKFNIKTITNSAMVRIFGLPEDIADRVDIKAENDYVMGQGSAYRDSYNVNAHLIDAGLKRENSFIGEDHSSDDNDLLAEQRQKDKMISVEVQEVTKILKNTSQEKINTSRNPEADGGCDSKFSCNKCPYETYSELQLLAHSNAHNSSVSYSCNMCYITIRNSYLERHLKTHSNEKPFSCGTCYKTYSQKSNLSTHMRKHATEQQLSCDICNKTFYQKRSLTAHMSTHTGEKRFSCNICNKRFYQKFNLKTHMSTHSGEKRFSCDICNKAFYQKRSLTGHMSTHTGEKRFSCDICNKEFYRKSNLKIHLSTHTGEKPFFCQICSRTFSQKSNLTAHLSTHADKKQFSCDVCNKAFYYKRSLAAHTSTHTGENRFSCDICDKTFYQQFSLKTHMSTHTGEKHFSCNICNKYFYQKRNLTGHMKIHTDEKRFSCDVCHKNFYRKYNLKIHMSTHIAKKEFPCHICNRIFIQRSYLTMHMSTHAYEKPLVSV